MINNKESFITRISTFFIKKWKFTVLLLISLLLLGTYSYTDLLEREGFPPIEFPVSTIQTTYFAESDIVYDMVSKPIEEVLADIPEIDEFKSNTADNFSFFVIQYEEGLTSQEGSDLVQESIEQAGISIEGTNSEYGIINPTALDNKNDLLLSISGEGKSISELESKADEIVKSLNSITSVQQASTNYQITNQLNPFTGAIIEQQTSFGRVGYKEDGTLKFEDAIDIGIIKTEEAEIIELSDEVRDEIETLQTDSVLDGYKINYSNDFSTVLKDQIKGLESNIIQGLIAIIIVLLLLVNFRSALVTAAFVPIVLAGTFFVLYLLGMSLNTITLFALILVLGLFVDDAIVVVEAIDYYKKQGNKGIKAIKLAINDIGRADLSGTLTTILVFSPLLFVSGVLGEFIREVPISVIVALVVSLGVALTIIPLLSNYIIPDKKVLKNKAKKNIILKIAERFSLFIKKIVNSNLNIGIVIISSLLLIGVGGYFATQLSFSIFPKPRDADAINMTISFPEGTDISKARDLTIDTEEIIYKNIKDEVISIAYHSGTPRSIRLNIKLTGVNERDINIYEILESITEDLKDIEEQGVDFDTDIVSHGPPSSDFQFFAQIYGQDEEVIYGLADDISEYLESEELSELIGTEIVEVRVDNKELIKQVDGNRFIEIKARLKDSEDTSYVLAIIEEIENEFDSERLRSAGLLSDSLEFDLGQESDNIESFNSTTFSLVISLLIMYILLVFLFDSFIQPLLIFLAIPFTFPGLFSGLLLTGNAMSFFVMIGVIGLSGIVVNNTIMLVEIANQRRDQGMNAKEAITEAIKLRFRPLVTTSITTIVGLLPLAILDPFWEPLAVTIMFGLVSSLIMVLLGFPAFYVLIENTRIWFMKLFKRK